MRSGRARLIAGSFSRSAVRIPTGVSIGRINVTQLRAVSLARVRPWPMGLKVLTRTHRGFEVREAETQMQGRIETGPKTQFRSDTEKAKPLHKVLGDTLMHTLARGR